MNQTTVSGSDFQVQTWNILKIQACICCCDCC